MTAFALLVTGSAMIAFGLGCWFGKRSRNDEVRHLHNSVSLLEIHIQSARQRAEVTEQCEHDLKAECLKLSAKPKRDRRGRFAKGAK